MKQPPERLGFEQIQSEEFHKILLRYGRARFFLAPLISGVICLLVMSEPSVWRRVLILSCMGIALFLTLIEFRRFLARLKEPRLATPRFAVFALPVLSLMLFATGGIESPILPILVGINVVVALMAPRKVSLAFSAAHVIVLWGLLFIATREVLPDFIPSIFGGGPRAGHNNTLLYSFAGLMTFVLFWSGFIGWVMQRAIFSTIRRVADARDEALQAHEYQTRALMSLSGEIAHELKNPLASVKGLATLVSKDLDGKAAERMTVLRREVDRMQEILETFLNFSRPLIPLNEQQVLLGELCQNVLQLYEGLARERQITLTLSDDQHVQAWCDPRKVKQVLINLVQNAVEASGAGGSVELGIRLGPSNEAIVEVLDRGTGMPKENGDRVFEPGVTTKGKGSGLGLTIARGIARQHGGDIELRARLGGGCIATLTLPVQPNTAVAAGAVA